MQMSITPSTEELQAKWTSTWPEAGTHLARLQARNRIVVKRREKDSYLTIQPALACKHMLKLQSSVDANPVNPVSELIASCTGVGTLVMVTPLARQIQNGLLAA